MNPEVKIEVKSLTDNPDAKMVLLDGDLDSTNAETLLDHINQWMNQGFYKYVVDFQLLRYINSIGIGVLMHFHNTAVKRKGCFKIAAMNKNVLEVINVIGANQFLEIYDTVEEAVSSLND